MSEPLPFYKTVIAGASAGVIEIAVMYPTDIAKTRAQLNVAGRISMWETLSNIVRQEGLVQLYRGVASPIVAEAPKRATKFASNEEFKKLLRADDGSLSSARAGLSGALAGTVEAFINCPFETIKVRMQAKENLNRFRSTWDCTRQLMAQEGPLALYRGIEAQVWRNAAWNGTYFACIGGIRNALPTEPGDSKALVLSKKFVSGLIGGTLGVLMNTPLDVVKSRMQNQMTTAQPKYRYVLPSLLTILREEGVTALYKGLGPRMVRLGPGGGIMIVAFDVVSNMLS